MKYCPNCGKKIKNNVVFCPYCGAKQEFSHKVNPLKLKMDSIKHNKKIILILSGINLIWAFLILYWTQVMPNCAYTLASKFAAELATLENRPIPFHAFMELIYYVPPILISFILSYFILIKIAYTKIKFRRTFTAVTIFILIYIFLEL